MGLEFFEHTSHVHNWQQTDISWSI